MAEQIAKKLQFSFSQYLKTAEDGYVQVPISNSRDADNEFVVDVDPRHLEFDIRGGRDYAAAAAGQPVLQQQFEVYHPDAADDRKDNPVRRLRRIVEIDVDSKDESIEAQEFQALNDFGRDVLLTWTPPAEAVSQLQTLGIEMRLDEHNTAHVEMALTHREALFLQLGLERAYPGVGSADTKYDGVLGAVEQTSRGMYDYLKSIKDRTTEFQNAAADYQQRVANGLRDNLARYAVKQSTGLDVRVPAKRGFGFANIKAALWDDLGTTFLSDVEENGGVPADTIKAAAAAGTAAFVFAPFAAAGAAVLGVATGVSYLGLSAWAGASVANELANSHRIVGSGLAEQFILNGFTDTLVRNPIDAAFSGYVMYRMHTDVDSRTTAFRQRVKDFESEVAKAKANDETLPDLAKFLSREINNLKQEEPELGKALEAKNLTTTAELGDELEKQLKTDLADQLRDVDRTVGYYSALMFRQRGTWSLIDGLDYVQGIKLSGVALATSASLSVLRAFMGRLSMSSDNQGYVVSGITTAAKAMAVRYANSPSGAVWDAIANTADVGLAGTLQLFGAGMVIYLGVTKVLPAAFGWLKKAATVASFTLGTVAHLAGVNNPVVSVDPVQLLRDWLKVDEKGQDERLNLFTIHSPHTSRAYALVVLLRVLIRWYNTMADCLLRDSRGKICLLAVSELYRCRTIIMTAYNHALSLLTGSVSMCIVMNSANMDTNKSLYENYKAPANAPQVTEMKRRVEADDKRISDEMQLVLSMFRQACDKISEIDATHEDAGVTDNPDDIQLAFINYFEDNDLTTEVLNRTAPTISPLAQIAARGAGVFCAMASQYIACMENTYGDLEHFALITKVDEKSTLIENASVMFSLTVVMDMLFMHELYLPTDDPFLPHLIGVNADAEVSALHSPWLSSFLSDTGKRVSNVFLKKLLTGNVRRMELYMVARQLTSPYCTVMDYMASRASMFAFQNKIQSFMAGFDDRQKRRFAQRRTMQFDAFFQVYANYYIEQNAHHTLIGRMNAPTRYSRLSVSSVYQMSHLYLYGGYMEWFFQPGYFNTTLHVDERKVSLLSLDELGKRVSFVECMRVVKSDKTLRDQLRQQLLRILLTFSNLVLPRANERLSLQTQLYECIMKPDVDATSILRRYLSEIQRSPMAPRDIVRMLRFLAMALERSESSARELSPRLLPPDVTNAFASLLGWDSDEPIPYFWDCAIILYVCTLLRHQVGDMPLLYEAEFDDHARCINGTVGPIDVDAFLAHSVEYDMFHNQVQGDDDVAIPAVSSVTRPRGSVDHIKRGEPSRIVPADQKRPDQYLRTNDEEVVLWTDMWNKFVALYISSTARVDMNTLLNKWDVGFEKYYSEYNPAAGVFKMTTAEETQFGKFAIVLKSAARGKFKNDDDKQKFIDAAGNLYNYCTTDAEGRSKTLKAEWTNVKDAMDESNAVKNDNQGPTPNLMKGNLGKDKEYTKLWNERLQRIDHYFKDLRLEADPTNGQKLCIELAEVFVIALYFQSDAYFRKNGEAKKVEAAAEKFQNSRRASAPAASALSDEKEAHSPQRGQSAMDAESSGAESIEEDESDGSDGDFFNDDDALDDTKTGQAAAAGNRPQRVTPGRPIQSQMHHRRDADTNDDSDTGMHHPSHTGLRNRKNRKAKPTVHTVVKRDSQDAVHGKASGGKWNWLIAAINWWTTSGNKVTQADAANLEKMWTYEQQYKQEVALRKAAETQVLELRKENRTLRERLSVLTKQNQSQFHETTSIVPTGFTNAMIVELREQFERKDSRASTQETEEKSRQAEILAVFQLFRKEISDLLFLRTDTGETTFEAGKFAKPSLLEMYRKLSRKDIIYRMQHLMYIAHDKRTQPTIEYDELSNVLFTESAVDHVCRWSGIGVTPTQLEIPLLSQVNNPNTATKMVIYIRSANYQQYTRERMLTFPQFVYSPQALQGKKIAIVKVIQVDRNCIIHRVMNLDTQQNNLMLIVEFHGDKPSDDLQFYLETLHPEDVPFKNGNVTRVTKLSSRPRQEIQVVAQTSVVPAAAAAAAPVEQQGTWWQRFWGRG